MKSPKPTSLSVVLTSLALLASIVTSSLLTAPGTSAHPGSAPQMLGDHMTATPIKHVIVVIGENHTFDNIFGAYKPRHGQHVENLLSEGIINADGSFGPNVARAEQWQALDTAKNPGAYSINPPKTQPYATLPQPNTTYAIGQPQNVPDTRFPADLPNGPYQITKYVPYHNAYVGDPIHRFYQMWQQVDEGKSDLFTWVHQTSGDDNGAIPPAPIYQGALDMGYYNVNRGDAPLLDFLANHFAMSDNYHQSVMGGTGTNHIMIGSGDAAYYVDASGNPVAPPSNQIENPNPKVYTSNGQTVYTNNNYTQDGYSGGSYSNCADTNQPGVGAIMSYLNSLPYKPFNGGDCAPGHYYLLNNYLPGYTPTGQPTTGTPYFVPPQSLPTIANELSAHNISWKYYGQGWNNGNPTKYYCPICDPFQYETSIMTTPLRQNLQGFTQFEQDVANNRLPAVSFVKPSEIYDGHPASSALSLFESFTRKVLVDVMSHHNLFSQTAVFVTFDEGGGYYDSGYIQPITFFGDGTRVPMIVVSPYVRPGYIDHTYYDHNSILKFIEENWHLPTLSSRSLDNLPDPRTARGNPYVPINGPAVGDLMPLFDFSHPRFESLALPHG